MTLQNQNTRTPLVADQVYDVLANAIFNGDLARGSRLRVRDIAAMVGTSEMPVREALRRLEENGLTTTEPHKGARVRAFTISELIHIYDVRGLLEVEATRKGLVRATEADLEAMSVACERMHVAVQEELVSAALDADESLLRRLYQASGNPFLVDAIETLWTQCRAYKVIGATAAIRQQDLSLWTPQAALVAAVRARDVPLAVSITSSSVASAQQRLENELATVSSDSSETKESP